MIYHCTLTSVAKNQMATKNAGEDTETDHEYIQTWEECKIVQPL
jgi:hypothetical protein